MSAPLGKVFTTGVEQAQNRRCIGLAGAVTLVLHLKRRRINRRGDERRREKVVDTRDQKRMMFHSAEAPLLV
jgi:hypothetical protein